MAYVPEALVVKGKAVFEKRHTLVPMSVCESDNCPRSQPYWVLVVSQGETKYELDQLFATGSTIPPEFVEVAGVVIRSGSRVVFDAQIEKISPRYALIVEVQRASLLMDDNREYYPEEYGEEYAY